MAIVVKHLHPAVSKNEHGDKDEIDGNTGGYSGLFAGGTASKLLISSVLCLACMICLYFAVGRSATTYEYVIGGLFLVTRTVAILLTGQLCFGETDSTSPGGFPFAGVLVTFTTPALAVLTLILMVIRPNIQISSTETFIHALLQAFLVDWSFIPPLTRLCHICGES